MTKLHPVGMRMDQLAIVLDTIVFTVPREYDHDTIKQEIRYALGHYAPRYPVPAIQGGAYVLACELDTSVPGLQIVVWFADHTTLVV